MIQLFEGTDTFESYTKVKKEAKAAAKSENLDLEIIDADEDIDKHTILEKVEGVGLFSDSNILLLKRLDQNKKLVEFFIDNFEKLDKYPIFIWIDGKADSRQKLINLIKKEKRIKSFELPKPWQFESWISMVAKQKDFSLTKSQINFLIERNSESKWLLLNELFKINAFLKNNNKKSLTDLELEELCSGQKGDIWKFVDDLGNKKYRNMLLEGQKLINYEESVQYIISMIHREINLMTKVKMFEKLGKPLKEMRLHPFVLQKTTKKAQNFSLEDLKKLLIDLFNLDLSIKKGEIEEKIGFKMYIGNLMLNEKGI